MKIHLYKELNKVFNNVFYRDVLTKLDDRKDGRHCQYRIMLPMK